MNELIVSHGAPVATMTSREIAELTNKQHQHVLFDIRKMLAELKEDESSFRRIYFDGLNRQQTEYHLDRELTETLLTGYSAILRRKVIARWRELEARAAAPLLPNFADPVAAARAWADAIETQQVLTIERDAAIATKAQIGNRREATAMATASSAKKESAKLKEQLGFGARYATIIAVERVDGRNFGTAEWRPLKAWCKANNEQPKTVPCPRYGTAQAWPAGAWLAVYGVTLSDIFAEVAA